MPPLETLKFQFKGLFFPHIVPLPYCCLVTQLCLTLETPWTGACQASLSFAISWSLLKLRSIESVMLSNHLILSCPLLLWPLIFPRSESYPMSRLITSGHQNIRALSVASVLPMTIQGWFPLGLTGLISLLSEGLCWFYGIKNIQTIAVIVIIVEKIIK